jgi:hypothetical protein
MRKEKCRLETNDTNATSYVWRSAQNPKTSKISTFFAQLFMYCEQPEVSATACCQQKREEAGFLLICWGDSNPMICLNDETNL